MGRANLSNRNTNRRELENLEATPGFASSGTSQWERHAAHGGKVETQSIRDFNSMSRLEQLIHRNVKELINLSDRLGTEHDPVAQMKISKSMAIKRRFIDRLRAEQQQQ
jgi:hypothetical protein